MANQRGTLGRNEVRPTTVAEPCAGARCTRRAEAGRERLQTVGGSGLCPTCKERLAGDLRQLPELYHACGQLLGGSSGPRGLHERTSGGPLPGMPFNTAAAEARTAIISVLGSWAGLVADAREVTPPSRTVEALATFLSRHVDWLTAHSAAGDVSAEVARLVRNASRVATPTTHRRVPVGSCPEPGCEGTLNAPIRIDTPDSPIEIRCSADPAHNWAEREWTRLSRRMRRSTSATPASATTMWLTAADISRLWGIPPGSVYRLASEQNWRRRRRGGRMYYHDADVQSALHRRRLPSGSRLHPLDRQEGPR